MRLLRTSRSLLQASIGVATVTIVSCRGGGCIAGNLMGVPVCPEGTVRASEWGPGCVETCPPGERVHDAGVAGHHFCEPIEDAGTDASLDAGSDASLDSGPDAQ